MGGNLLRSRDRLSGMRPGTDDGPSRAETINEERTMTAPTTTIAPTIEEEYSCDQIAKYWVKAGGNLVAWRANFNSFIDGFSGEPVHPLIRSVTDTWEEWGYTREDFERLNKEIEGWVVSYTSAHGRIFL